MLVSDAPVAFTDDAPVAFAGDWHGNTQWMRHALNVLADHGVRVVYHVGDFGLWPGMDGASYLRKTQRELDRHGMTLCVTPGNHEDWDRLERFERDANGFQTRADVPRILFAPRGHVWTHQGVKFGSLGGAVSVDQDWRTMGLSWWPQEAIRREDVDVLAANGPVDILITHEAPAGIHKEVKFGGIPRWIEDEAYKQRMLVRDALDAVTPKLNIHGHWHRFTQDTIEGVGCDGNDYTCEVIGLDMDGTSRNLLIGELAVGSPLVGRKFLPR